MRGHVHSHALCAGYTCIRAGTPGTDTLAGSNVSALRAGGCKSINRAGCSKSGDHRQHAFYSRHFFFVRSSIREAVIQRNRRPRQREKLKPRQMTFSLWRMPFISGCENAVGRSASLDFLSFTNREREGTRWGPKESELKRSWIDASQVFVLKDGFRDLSS